MSLCDSLMPYQEALGFSTHSTHGPEAMGKMVPFSTHFP